MVDVALLVFCIFVLDDKSLRGAGAGLFSEYLNGAILFLSSAERRSKGDWHKL